MGNKIKLFKHTFTEKYPRWDEPATTVTITKTEENPFTMFSREAEIAKIDKEVELYRNQSLERGGDGETFLSNVYFQCAKEGLSEIEKIIPVEYVSADQLLCRAKTVSGYRKLKIRMLDDNIPTQEYSVEEVEIRESFIKEVDGFLERAVWLWGFCDPEPAIRKLYNKAINLATTDLEKVYVNALDWM